jgi:uncharacterized protein
MGVKVIGASIAFAVGILAGPFLAGMQEAIFVVRHSDWWIRTETRAVMTCTKESFEIAAIMEAFEAEKRVFSRTSDRRIPRDLV